MITRFIILLFCITSNHIYPQCLNANNLHTNNINYSNALANWSSAPIADRYHVHFRELGTIGWNNLANINGGDTTRNIPGLTPSTTYEWQIKTFCDSTNQPNSGWSYSDTFTTPAFLPAPFNPIITKTLSSLECNAQALLYIRLSQAANEPDIGTSIITTDGGVFDIGSVSIGDSVGYATLTHTNQSIVSTLRVGLVAGQNYAIINSYDSLGSLIGFFSVENTNGGIKIETTSPNDGNNYTSGYISELYFTNLFVNPANAGPLLFFANFESELNNYISRTDTSQIWCYTMGTNELSDENDVEIIYNIVGKKTILKTNAIQLIRLSDGRIKKQIQIKNW